MAKLVGQEEPVLHAAPIALGALQRKVKHVHMCFRICAECAVLLGVAEGL